MTPRIQRSKLITREYVRSNPDRLFLFGDNLEQMGFGGQAAAMRGEPNAIGIPTKKSPTNAAAAFFTDEEFELNKAVIDDAFARMLMAFKVANRAYQVIVIPVSTASEPAGLNWTNAPRRPSPIYSKDLRN